MAQRGFFDRGHKNPDVPELQGRGDVRVTALVGEFLQLPASPSAGRNFGRTGVPHPGLGTCQLRVLKIKQVPR